MRIVFMGTPDFAAASLRKLLDEKFEVVGVFTQPDKPKGRGMELAFSPVKELALQAGLPVFQPDKMRDGRALSILQQLQPDILVVVAYGRILPDELLEKLSAEYVFEYQERIDDSHSAVRFCTSWATREEAIDSLLSAL